MIERHPFDGPGGARHGWLDANHILPLLNSMPPGAGSLPYQHADMEIIACAGEGTVPIETAWVTKATFKAGIRALPADGAIT